MAVRTPYSAIRRLIALGAEQGIVAQLCGRGDLAAARVHIEDDGARWCPEGAEPRLLLGVREGGGLVDVLALDSRSPDTWALRRGAAVLLGFDLWARTMVAQSGELRLFGSPFDWLAGGGGGVCVLDWGVEALGMLRGLGAGVTLAVDRCARDGLLTQLKWGGLPGVRAIDALSMQGAA